MGVGASKYHKTAFLSIKVVKFIGSRKDLTEDKLDALEELVMDSMKAEAIYEAAKMSMGKSMIPQ